MIKPAKKNNISNISTLILDAIHNIANTLTGQDEFYIDTVSVSEKFRGQGISKELFVFIEEKAKELGFKKVSLLVDFENPKALALYKRIGFRKNTILEVSNHNYHHMIKMI